MRAHLKIRYFLLGDCREPLSGEENKSQFQDLTGNKYYKNTKSGNQLTI